MVETPFYAPNTQTDSITHVNQKGFKMQETVSGLHKCQPKNEPKEGDTKNLVVLQMPAKGTKKPWIKIKSESLEKGGSPYRIVSVTPTGWEPDDYGNVSFNLDVEAVNGEAEQATISGHRAAQAETKAKGELHQQYSMLDERQRAIIRQHSQSMALEVLKLKVTLNELHVEDLKPSKLKELADYFDNDVIGAAQ